MPKLPPNRNYRETNLTEFDKFKRVYNDVPASTNH